MCVVGNLNAVEGVLSSKVTVDGIDSTNIIVKMFNGSRFREQVKLLAFNGIAIAGLNIIDVTELEKRLKMRAIIVTRHRPRLSLLIRALKLLQKKKRVNIKERMKLLKSQKKSVLMEGFYVQSYTERKDIEKLVETSANLLRLAHMIASGISSGESKGRI